MIVSGTALRPIISAGVHESSWAIHAITGVRARHRAPSARAERYDADMTAALTSPRREGLAAIFRAPVACRPRESTPTTSRMNMSRATPPYSTGPSNRAAASTKP